MNQRKINYLSSLWGQQLYCEFDEICQNYDLTLRPPVFEITHSTKQLGSWQAATRTICISSALITKHSWDVTLNVLKHEIAHQICSELFVKKETAHGALFQTASELIGLPEEYRGASGDLPELIEHLDSVTQPTKEGRQFIRKVEKLLALAQSSNEHEAALAMQKANELIEKHTIRRLNAEQRSHYTSLIIDKKRQRLETYQRHICSILRDFFYVEIVYAYLYDPLLVRTHKTIELLGTPENVEIAEYCYHFLENQLSTLWSQNRHRFNGQSRTEKNSYYLGLLNGFYKKLEKQKKIAAANRAKAPSNSTKVRDLDTTDALMTVEDNRLTEYVRSKFPRLRTLSRRAAKIVRSTYNEGRETGATITLNKGVSATKGNRGKLLTFS